MRHISILRPRKRTAGRDEIENKRAGKRVYCFALLCRLTCSVVRRMRRLMAACSFRASLSVSATTFSVAPMRRAVSASSSQCARSSSLGWLRLPRSQAGMVECWAVCGSGAGFMKNITAQLRCHTKGLCLIPHTYFQSTCCQRGSAAGSGGSYYLFFLATFHFAHRARCAAAIRFRPAADILRIGRLPRERLKPLRTEIALSSAFNCACSLLRSLCRSRTALVRSATIPRVNARPSSRILSMQEYAMSMNVLAR